MSDRARGLFKGRMRVPVVGVLIGVLVGAFGAASSGGATSSGSGSGADVVSSEKLTAAQAEAVEDYWTPQRMANAKPMPVPERSGEEADPGATVSEPTGEPGVTPAATPSGAAVGADLSLAEPVSDVEPVNAAFHTAGPTARWNWFGRFRRFPISTISKMFFTQNGVNFVCSASTIKGGPGTAGMWTAGHCVSDGSQTFSTNVFVCPSYDNGVNPAVGCWAADSLVTLTDWHVNGVFEADMGVIDTAPNGTVQPGEISSTTGNLGLAWNFSRHQQWLAFGYPQGSPFTGGKITIATSEFMYEDDSLGGDSRPNSSSMANDMTGGSSGGPWTFDLNSAVSASYPAHVNGHNDWRHTAFPFEMNSPYFDDRAKLLWDAL